MCRGSLGLCKKHQKVVLNLKNYMVRLHNLTYITLIRNLFESFFWTMIGVYLVWVEVVLKVLK